MILWFLLKLEISYRLIIYLEAFWLFLKEDFFRLYFCMVKYLSVHNSSFALRYFNVNYIVNHVDFKLNHLSSHM